MESSIQVTTITGVVPKAELGIILPHEHIFINLMNQFKEPVMKLSMMAYTDPQDSVWGQPQAIINLCQQAQEAGIDVIDWITTSGVAPEEIRRIADDYDITTVCYTFFSVDLNFPTTQERQAGLDILRKEMETAVILGANKIMLPISGKAGMVRAESRRHIIAGLGAAAPLAKTMGVTITIEHLGDMRAPFIVSSDVNEAVRAVPELKITYDSGNDWLGGEDATVGYKNSREHIVHVHFKDWVPATDNGCVGADGRSYVMVPIGMGLVDHVSILKAMHAYGYNGCINMEFFGDNFDHTDARLRSMRYLSEQMDTLGIPRN